MSVNNATGNLSVALAAPLTSTSCTLMCWAFMPTVTGAFWTLFSMDDGGVGPFLQIARSQAAGNWDVWSETFSVSDGQPLFTEASAAAKWVSIALVGAPTTSTVYWSIAGAAISSKTISSSASGATKLWISDDGFNDGDFPGLITGVKVWSRSLSAAEIANEMAQMPPLNTSGIWAQYPELNSTNPNIDDSGNGRNATVGGTLSTSATMPSVPWRSQQVMGL